MTVVDYDFYRTIHFGGAHLFLTISKIEKIDKTVASMKAKMLKVEIKGNRLNISSEGVMVSFCIGTDDFPRIY